MCGPRRAGAGAEVLVVPAECALASNRARRRRPAHRPYGLPFHYADTWILPVVPALVFENSAGEHSIDPSVPDASLLVRLKVQPAPDPGSDVAITSAVPSPKFQICPVVPSADWVLT